MAQGTAVPDTMANRTYTARMQAGREAPASAMAMAMAPCGMQARHRTVRCGAWAGRPRTEGAPRGEMHFEAQRRQMEGCEEARAAGSVRPGHSDNGGNRTGARTGDRTGDHAGDRTGDNAGDRIGDRTGYLALRMSPSKLETMTGTTCARFAHVRRSCRCRAILPYDLHHPNTTTGTALTQISPRV